MVRRTIHSGWVSSKPISRSWSWPMSWMWRAGRVQPQPARAVDVADPQRPLAIEYIGVTVGHRHHYFVQAHGFAPRYPSSSVTQVNPGPRCESCQTRSVETPIAHQSRHMPTLRTPPSQRGYARDVPKTFVGSRVRQLRSERGFSQAALAQMLEISPSYLNQIEHDVRPLTVAVLLRITEVFGVDATFFAPQDDTRLVAELREVTMDRDLDIDVDPPEVAEMVSAHPALARAVVNLHRRYRITTAQLAAATEERFFDGSSGSGSITMPHEEVRDYFYERQNYLHELDTAAEDLTIQMRLHHGDLARELTRPADRGARRAHHQAHRSRRHRAAPLRPGDQDAGDQQSPLVGATGVQDGRRIGLPRVRRPDRQHGRRGQVHQRRSRTRWPGSGWPTTSPRPPCCRIASSTTSPRTSATTSSGCRRSTR